MTEQNTKPLTDKQIAAQDARYAIDGAITYGRMGTDKPEPGHWLAEYWSIGRQLAKLGETSIWDNQTPLAAAPAPTPSPAAPFQARVQPWMMECFGAEIAADQQERNHRFLEEALELVQSCGATASEAHQLVDYVYGRPVGDKHQEAGGVMVTLAALCLAQGMDMHASGETELVRIWTKVEQIRAKQAAKPRHSPLPEHVPPAAGVVDSSQAAGDVLAERRRQVEAEGWTPEHDDEHNEGELSLAAAGYAQSASDQIQCIAKELDDSSFEDHGCPSTTFPHGWQFKAAPPRRMLVKAGALILAEIERIDRTASRASKEGE